jgi:hypothetical protein
LKALALYDIILNIIFFTTIIVFIFYYSKDYRSDGKLPKITVVTENIGPIIILTEVGNK